MGMLRVMMGGALLMLSFFGYCFALARWKGGRIAVEFTPVFTCSLIVCVLLFAGFLNVLSVGAVLLLALGIMLLARSVWLGVKESKLAANLKAFVTPGILIIIAAAVVLAVVLIGARFVSDDDFSHWGTVVKYMYTSNEMPSYKTDVVSFQSYPLGSSLFLYYFVRFTGYHESIMLWALCFFMLCGLSSLFALPQKKNWVVVVLLTLSAFVAFSGKRSVYDLLVDALFPIIACATAVVILYYRKDPLWAAVLICPVLTCCIMIKNSGIYFVVLDILILLFYVFSSKKQSAGKWNKRAAICLCALVAAPFIVLLLWNAHVDLVFSAGEISKHAMRLDNIQGGLAQKTGEEVAAIIDVWTRYSMNISENRYAACWIIWNVVLVAAVLLHSKNNKPVAKSLVGWLVFVDIATVAYYIGLLGVYITTMPANEALNLDSYQRYAGSWFVFICGLLSYILADTVTVMPIKKSRVALCICWAGVLASYLAFPHIGRYTYIRPPYEESTLQVIDGYITERFEPDDMSYLVINDESVIHVGHKRTTTARYLRYHLMSYNFQVLTKDDIDKIDALAEEYDYLVVITDDETVTGFLRDHTAVGERDNYMGMYALPSLEKVAE